MFDSLLFQINFFTQSNELIDDKFTRNFHCACSFDKASDLINKNSASKRAVPKFTELQNIIQSLNVILKKNQFLRKIFVVTIQSAKSTNRMTFDVHRLMGLSSEPILYQSNNPRTFHG